MFESIFLNKKKKSISGKAIIIIIDERCNRFYKFLYRTTAGWLATIKRHWWFESWWCWPAKGLGCSISIVVQTLWIISCFMISPLMLFIGLTYIATLYINTPANTHPLTHIHIYTHIYIKCKCASLCSCASQIESRYHKIVSFVSVRKCCSSFACFCVVLWRYLFIVLVLHPRL